MKNDSSLLEVNDLETDLGQTTLKQKNIALDKKNKIYYYLGKKEKEVREELKVKGVE